MSMAEVTVFKLLYIFAAVNELLSLFNKRTNLKDDKKFVYMNLVRDSRTIDKCEEIFIFPAESMKVHRVLQHCCRHDIG